MAIKITGFIEKNRPVVCVRILYIIRKKDSYETFVKKSRGLDRGRMLLSSTQRDRGTGK